MLAILAMAETEKPKKKLSDYFSDMHIALGKSYSPPGGASILFAGEGFSTDWKKKYVKLHVMDMKHGFGDYGCGEGEQYHISDPRGMFNLDFKKPLWTMLVVDNTGEVLFNSYEYETPEGADWERGAFFDDVGYAITAKVCVPAIEWE